MGNAQKKGHNQDIHTASYNLDFVSVASIVEQYRASRTTATTSEVRNPVNQYGLVDGKALFFQQGSGSVPTNQLPSLLLLCHYNPSTAARHQDKLDPHGTGFVELNAFIEFYKETMRELEDGPLDLKELEHIKKIFKEKEYKRYVLKPHPAGARSPWAKQELLRKGRNKGLYGTPLHFICMRVTHTNTHKERQIDMVQYLLANGASLIPAKADGKNTFGVSAFELAETNGNSHLLPYLNAAQAGREGRRAHVVGMMRALDAEDFRPNDDAEGAVLRKAHDTIE
eukprot:TRINITY_DN66791_c8_g1_i1.p1 TRINITY_DN66791_c8_g1~~TRINITY_DN66791_c8_g1_i1.p1  ORF type:complete len:283 (-),score=16.41 TRINITY_DN66791_c8_g1_i1:157-1005(-)